MHAILFGTGTAFALMVLAWLVRYRALSVRRAVVITCLIWSAGLAAYLVIQEDSVAAGVAGIALGVLIGIVSRPVWSVARLSDRMNNNQPK